MGISSPPKLRLSRDRFGVAFRVKNKVRVKTKQRASRLVVKFGGTSLSAPRKIARAVNAVHQEMREGSQIAIVVSAMGGTTDNLLETISGVSSPNGSSDHVDDILSMGERTSARVFHAALSAQGVRAKYFDPYDDGWPIVTDDHFGDAAPIMQTCKARIRRYVLSCLNEGTVPVIPGFIGKTLDGRITTMGRGGSDITAFILARYLDASESILVTDTDGLMTADPKLVQNARPLRQIRIHELIGLSDSGTKFLKGKALKYLDGTFRVRITSNTTSSLRSGGTIVDGSFPGALTAELESPDPCAMVTIAGHNISQNPSTIQDMLSRITQKRAKILGFSANSNSLIIYIPSNRKGALLKTLHRSVLAHSEMTAMAVRDNLSLIRIAGVGLADTPGLIASVSQPLRENSLNIYGIFTIASSIALVIDWKQRTKALNLVKSSLRRTAAT